MSCVVDACREAEDAAAIARTRYDEAKQQREVAEAKNQSFKQLEQQHLSSEWLFLQTCLVGHPPGGNVVHCSQLGAALSTGGHRCTIHHSHGCCLAI